MSSSRLVRGAKTRMFAFVCFICVLGAVVFVFHGTQSKLAEVQKIVNSCNQQQESLSAQLQVIFEYKVRLEKSLFKEKDDHKQTKETLETKLREEKSNKDKDSLEAKNKYEALVQQNKFLQNQLDDLKESEKKQISKLDDENKQLQKELETFKKENEELAQQKTHDVEHLKTEYLKQQDEIKALIKENDHLKMILPANDQQTNHLVKENLQLKDEIEKLKHDIHECKIKNSQVKSKLDVLPQPDTNVGEMPGSIRVGSKSINGSTTPGLNPEAVYNFDITSPKPAKEAEPLSAKKPDEQVAQPPKKPTQESVAPLPVPRQSDNEFGQIPVPGNGLEHDHDPLGNTLHKPNTGNVGQGEEPDSLQIRPGFIGAQGDGEPDPEGIKLFAPAPLDINRGAEEDNIQKQGEIPRIKDGENYPHDYEHGRDQPEDEEDEEGEQLDYDERARKEQKNVVQQPLKIPAPNRDGGGVMVNPK